MKVPASIRRLYDAQYETNERLRVAVDTRMQGLKQRRWHYESRIKELPSYALKVESGRFQQPGALEDFFACTIVVANATEVATAEALVTDAFAKMYRRPTVAGRTHKQADAFPFDDLRLYVHLQNTPASPPTDLAAIIFEVQIKTFLQHAWSIATHDLLYKTDDANWSKERIAYQIKAMLEHAEISIQQAEELASCVSLSNEDDRTTEIKEAIAFVKRQWGVDELPSDVRRLASNITELRRGLKMEQPRLEQILDEGKARRSGAHPTNLSPYGTVVQYVFAAEKDKMIAFLQRDERGGRPKKVLIPEEVELPSGVDRTRLRNAIFVT